MYTTVYKTYNCIQKVYKMYTILMEYTIVYKIYTIFVKFTILWD